MSSVGALQTSPQQTEANHSATTSVNGSSAATETTMNTEGTSATEDSVPRANATPAAVKPASAPPKINPWKTRAEKTSTTKVQDDQFAAAKQDTAITDISNGNDQAFRKTHRPSKSTAPAIDDASLWPTLDKAAEDSADKKLAANEANENGLQSAPRVTGKEKWTKYTPTIIHTPLPSKSGRGGATAGSNATKNTARGGAATRPSRESAPSDKSEAGVESTSKGSRSSETSRPRSTKARSMSVSNTRTDRVPRRAGPSETESSNNNHNGARSQSSKRSDRGSVSAPSGNTPISDASKSPQVSSTNSTQPEGVSNGHQGEARVHRGSYDSNISTRPRGAGGYRGTRGNYQGNYNTRYQNPANFTSQAHLQNNNTSSNNNRMYSRDQMPYGFDQYQNFVNPAIAPVMIDPMMARHMVLNQCEYYFSIENLCKDLFLRKHMDAEGFVNLPILANFNRLRSITLDYALIRDVCVMSTLIELRAAPGSYDKIRRVEGWEQWVLPEDQRDPSTKAVPESVAEIPIASADESQGDMSSNIGARSFVPGQSSHDTQPPTNTLNENFANLGIGSRLSPEVKEFQSQNNNSK